MKTNILLLDSYLNIENLISAAFSFSRRINASLKIIYVFDFEWMRQSYLAGAVETTDPSLVAIENNARQQFDVAESKINELVKKYRDKEGVDVQYEVNVSELNRVDIINDEWKKNKDLILLLSTHQSYTEASGGLIGYPDILSHVKCPVLAMPEDIKSVNWNSILYATDYHSEDIAALKHLHKLINSTARITLVHVSKKFEFEEKLKWYGFREVMKQEAGIDGLEFELKKGKNVEEGLQEYIDKNNPDLLAVLKERKGFFKEIFTSSETKHILTKFNKPVLVYHEG